MTSHDKLLLHQNIRYFCNVILHTAWINSAQVYTTYMRLTLQEFCHIAFYYGEKDIY
jgi:hypothetical protein